MFFLKALSVLVSFLLSLGEAENGEQLVCIDLMHPLLGYEVQLAKSSTSELVGFLFNKEEDGEFEKLAEYPCVPISEPQYFKGHRVLQDCHLPHSWDEGYDLLWVDDKEVSKEGKSYVFVHELGFTGPTLKAKLSCETNAQRSNFALFW